MIYTASSPLTTILVQNPYSSEDESKLDLFTEDRFEQVKAAMKHGMTKDAWLKNYLSLDPANKAQWCAAHLVKLVDGGHL